MRKFGDYYLVTSSVEFWTTSLAGRVFSVKFPLSNIFLEVKIFLCSRNPRLFACGRCQHVVSCVWTGQAAEQRRPCRAWSRGGSLRRRGRRAFVLWPRHLPPAVRLLPSGARQLWRGHVHVQALALSLSPVLGPGPSGWFLSKFNDDFVNFLRLFTRIYNPIGKVNIYSSYCSILQDVANAWGGMIGNSEEMGFVSGRGIWNDPWVRNEEHSDKSTGRKRRTAHAVRAKPQSWDLRPCAGKASEAPSPAGPTRRESPRARDGRREPSAARCSGALCLSRESQQTGPRHSLPPPVTQACLSFWRHNVSAELLAHLLLLGETQSPPAGAASLARPRRASSQGSALPPRAPPGVLSLTGRWLSTRAQEKCGLISPIRLREQRASSLSISALQTRRYKQSRGNSASVFVGWVDGWRVDRKMGG